MNDQNKSGSTTQQVGQDTGHNATPLQRRYSISARIGILAILLLVLQAVVSAYSFLLTATTNKSIEPIISISVPLERSIATVTTAQFEQNSLMQKILRIAKSSADEFANRSLEIQKNRTRFALLKQKVLSEFEYIQILLAQSEDFSHHSLAVDDIQKQYMQLMEDAETLLELISSGDTEIASTLINLMELDSEKLGADLQNLFTIISAAMIATVEDIRQQGDSFYIYTLLLGIGGVGFAGVFAAMIVRRLTHSANVVTTGITQASEDITHRSVGSARIPVESDDEFGQIARIFNRLLDELQVTMTLRDNAEDRLTKALQEAHEASKTKTQFLANMSHELRTPLNAILGYTGLLMEESGPHWEDSHLGDLQTIFNSGQHLLSLISDILDVSKIEARSMQIEPENVRLKDIVDAATGNIYPLLTKNNNKLHINVPDANLRLLTDELKVRQILLNLLSNATKFTHEGHITLEVSRQSEGKGKNWIIFTVTDDGIGIPHEDQVKIFEPFHQADNSPTRKYGGTGLGLSISKNLVEMLGGTLRVHSELGKGSKFIFTLPQEYS